MIKDITWEDIDKNNIQTKLGRIDGILMFNITRFNNKIFPNENWVMTSQIIPMGMITDQDSDNLKVLAYENLKIFIDKIKI
jgi:hypothetical protein